MENQRKKREQKYGQSLKSELAEHKNLINQFNKAEEKKNLENLLFGASKFPDSKNIRDK